MKYLIIFVTILCVVKFNNSQDDMSVTESEMNSNAEEMNNNASNMNDNTAEMNSSGVGMNSNGGGMNSNGVGMNSNGDGMNSNGVGMNSNGGGMNSNGVGMNSNGAGMNSNGAGMNSNGVGMNSNGVGMNDNGVGMSTTETPTTSEPTSNNLKPELIAYINRNTDQLLNKNPEKTSADIKIANIFNAERKKLADMKLNDSATQTDLYQVEQAMENFENFLKIFKEVEDKVIASIDELNLVIEDDNTSIEEKYEALSLLNDLKDSENIREAERNLRKFDKYKTKQQQFLKPVPLPSPVPFPAPFPLPLPEPTPPLTDECKKYLNEIINILKEHSMYDDPKMQDFLHQILNNPRELKKLAEALNKLWEEEDEDDYDDFFDFFDAFH